MVFLDYASWLNSNCFTDVDPNSSETFPRKFRYFATGCVTSEIESADEIDIWSINEHSIVINHRDATQRNPTCH